MSALCIFTLRFSWQASVCYGGSAGSLHVGWACLLAILPHVSWQGIFWLRHDWDSWHEVSHVDMFQLLGWDSWHWLRHVVSHVLVRGCHQSHGKWKRILWARNAFRSSRQLGWNRNFTHSLLVSLITICGFYIYNVFDTPTSDYSLFFEGQHMFHSITLLSAVFCHYLLQAFLDDGGDGDFRAKTTIFNPSYSIVFMIMI